MERSQNDGPFGRAYRLRLDLCRFNLAAVKGPFKGQLVKKPTALISNIPELANKRTILMGCFCVDRPTHSCDLHTLLCDSHHQWHS